ncbi:hypothetical protein LP52_06780 [Streptomonospora alba]|uniref:Uncharacterized protein n=1 Tax=Streptomonospora alba TaxID=183763 RepID=A0A0C2FJR9_9ACTN|nr:hypothetical protein [Streptomonospora alba]KIH99574.1 hypothetical protein LP52_06780 [Streptomonospora alba]
MIALVHTGLQMPHTRIRVTGLHQLETPTGVTGTAPLCEQDRRLGTITGPNGGAAHYQPSDRHARRTSSPNAAAARTILSTRTPSSAP